jgi:hypothetical protein
MQLGRGTHGKRRGIERVKTEHLSGRQQPRSSVLRSAVTSE